MEEKSGATEQKILKAAKTVFIKKGMDGARMQEIADEAGINKSLLHYYFRSKDKLFEAVFKYALSGFFPSISSMILKDIPVSQKMKNFAREYINTIRKNPFIPGFILSELNRDPNRLIMFFKEMLGPVRLNLLPMLSNAMQAGKEGSGFSQITVEESVVDIIALCIFPFIGRPLIQEILFNGNESQYDKFLENRAGHIGMLIDKIMNDNPQKN